MVNKILRKLRTRKKVKDRIVCLVGESGSGKSTLAEAMEKLGYTQIDSYTTRPPRSKSERHHMFVTQSEFDAIRPDLVAHTKFNRYEYGATRTQIRQNHMYTIDPAGVQTLAENTGRDNMLVVYLHTLPTERLRRMTETRGPSAARERLTHDLEKFSGFSDYDVLLLNNFPDQFTKNKITLEAILRHWF